MELLSLKKEEAIKQWKAQSETVEKLQSRNDSKQTSNVRTAFAVAGMGVGIMALTPDLSLAFTLMSGGLTLTGLTSAIFFYWHHAKTDSRLNIENNYCKEKELELVQNTRAKKGDAPQNTDHVSQLTRDYYESQSINYDNLIKKDALQKQDLKAMFGLIVGTVMVSSLGLGMVYSSKQDNSNNNSNATTGNNSARQEDIDPTQGEAQPALTLQPK